MHPKRRCRLLGCKIFQVKTWFAREKRSTEEFTRGRASSKGSLLGKTGLVVDPATSCIAQLVGRVLRGGGLRGRAAALV